MIKWDQTEKEILAQNIALARLQNIDASLTMLLNEAQSALPEHRRRGKLATHKLVPGLDALVKKQIELLLNKSEKTTIEYVKIEPEEAVKIATIGQLVEAVFEKVTTSFAASLAKEVAKIQKPSQVSVMFERPSEVEKAKGPVITIVGMYLANYRALENRIKKRFNDVMRPQLRYVDTDGSKPIFPQSTDYVVCVGNKMPHDWYDAARSKYGDRVQYVSGRVQQAEKAIVAMMENGGKVYHRRDVKGEALS